MIDPGRWWSLLLAVGGAALALLSAALVFGRAALLTWSLVLLGGEYALSLMLVNQGFDGRAPLYGGGLLAVAELGHWSTERAWPPAGDTARRLVVTALLAIAAVAAGSVLLAVATVGLTGGVGLEAAGVAAAVAALVLLTLLSRAQT